MQFECNRELRIEMLGNEAIVLDRSGKLVHHVSGDGVEALTLAREGIDDALVPAHLIPAMSRLVEDGLVLTSEWSRRRLLRAAGAGLAGATLVTAALASPAAAASGSISGVPLVKTLNGNNTPDPPLASTCLTGGYGNSVRGVCTWVRTETPATISVTIEMTTGTSAVGRVIYILQSSSATACLEPPNPPVTGAWAASPALGPQTFTAPIKPSATRFVVSLQFSGGGGVEGWSSHPVTLA